MGLFSRKQPKVSQPSEPTYVVQLHRVTMAGQEIAILNSWAPIPVRGLEAARRQAANLRDTNRWSGPDYWPQVTITDEEGHEVR